jgi:multiple sugar transport system substrate-binding protein
MPTPLPQKVKITYTSHEPVALRQEALKVFQERYPNITVDLQQIPGDFPPAIMTMVAAGTLPDVVRVWEPMVLEFGRAGQLIDLQPMIDAELAFDSGDFLESFYNFPVVNGKRFGIADGWNGHLCFYNKDMFDEGGVAYPTEDWAWDDYVSIARKLSKPDQQQWGSDSLYVGWLHWNYKLIWQNGGQVYNEDYSECLLDSPEAAEGIQYWADLLREAEIMPTPAQAEGLGDLFQTGRVAMQRMGSWVIAALVEGDFAWNLVPEPKQKERRTLIHTAFNVIPTTTKETDAAWKWLNFLVGPEGMFLYVKANATPSARRSVNEERPWAREGVDADWDLVGQAGEYGILVPAPPNTGVVEKIQADALQRIYLQEEKAVAVFREIAPKVTEALRAEA